LDTIILFSKAEKIEELSLQSRTGKRPLDEFIRERDFLMQTRYVLDRDGISSDEEFSRLTNLCESGVITPYEFDTLTKQLSALDEDDAIEPDMPPRQTAATDTAGYDAGPDRHIHTEQSKPSRLTKGLTAAIVVIVVVFAAVTFVVPFAKDKLVNAEETSAISDGAPKDIREEILSALNLDDEMDTINGSENPGGGEGAALPITADVLLSDYSSNPVSADGKYLGKTLSVTGVIESIDKGRSGDIQIMLTPDSGGSAMAIRCYFTDDAEIQKLASVNTGNSITITGNCTGSGTLEVVLQKCSVR
jgi:hypothetical protein